jgi:hypothetical protein
MVPGEGENFFSREKKFSPSPGPPLLFKKSGVFVEGENRCLPEKVFQKSDYLKEEV